MRFLLILRFSLQTPSYQKSRSHRSLPKKPTRESTSPAPTGTPLSPPTDAHLHIAEAGGSGPMPGAHGLHRLTLAAVRSSPDYPFVAIAHGIARSPELWGDAGVGSIFQYTSQFAVLNFIGHLHAKLEVQAAVIDAPTLVDAHVDAVIGIGNQV